MSALQPPFTSPPLSAIPQVLMDAFRASEALNDEARADPGEVETQRIYATFEGAQTRARTCGMLSGHDQQAAAILVTISEIDMLLSGGMTLGGADGLRGKLDRDEIGVIELARDTLARLLDWHFKNGAGALLPYADFLGLVRKTGRAA